MGNSLSVLHASKCPLVTAVKYANMPLLQPFEISVLYAFIKKGLLIKMLESRPEDALVKLVKLVNIVKLVKQWRLY